MSALIGSAMTRIDGVAKVCGAAQYAADFDAPRLAHAVMVQSTIAKGSIAAIGSDRAQSAPGVLLVMTDRKSVV